MQITADLATYQQRLGAELAPDGIPRHYNDLASEYNAALSTAVIMERSHEGRLRMTGKDRLTILHRISTGDLEKLPAGSGRPTIFTNPNGRIIDRAVIFNDGDSTLILTEPGRAPAVRDYLQRNIFFNDGARIVDETPLTRQFNLHITHDDTVIAAGFPQLHDLPLFACQSVIFQGVPLTIVRLKPVLQSNFALITATEHAVQVLDNLLNNGRERGLMPAGSLTYNTLRTRAGRPGVGRELSADYIPLEVGLWDEVSFTKGCYTGQEIIARMESRGRLAKTLVAIQLSAFVEAPAPVYVDGREIGRMTSSVAAPDGTLFAMGVIKLGMAHAGTTIAIGENAVAAVIGVRLGVQPDHMRDDG